MTQVIKTFEEVADHLLKITNALVKRYRAWHLYEDACQQAWVFYLDGGKSDKEAYWDLRTWLQKEIWGRKYDKRTKDRLKRSFLELSEPIEEKADHPYMHTQMEALADLKKVWKTFPEFRDAMASFANEHEYTIRLNSNRTRLRHALREWDVIRSKTQHS